MGWRQGRGFAGGKTASVPPPSCLVNPLGRGEEGGWVGTEGLDRFLQTWRCGLRVGLAGRKGEEKV